MEHRWGQRIGVDLTIRIVLPRCPLISIGRLTNISLSGTFLTPPFDLKIFARFQVLFELPHSTKHLASATDAFVARKSVQGIGLEWCDFSPPAVIELIRFLATTPLRELEWQTEAGAKRA